jgi:predicted DNA binding CopG/RHH family protein
MRASVQDQHLKLRASGSVVTAAKERASREGITFSALVRRAIDRELGRAA